MVLKSLQFVAVAAAGTAFGLTLAHVLERPGKTQLSGAGWLQLQHTFYGGFAIVGGAAEVGGLLAALGILVVVRRRPVAAGLALLGVVGFAGMLGSYALGNRPLNAEIAGWTAATLPADWTSVRDAWDTAHAISAGFGALALASLLAGTLREAR